ncbi:MAG: YceI family protein [Steroidobacteraceae bacterium]
MPPNKLTAALLIVLWLFGCSAPAGRRTEASTVAQAPRAAAAPKGPADYRIDSARSELRVLVFRAGPMAFLGHDHVILNRALAGWVDPGAGIGSSSFHLEIPVAEFAVDDAAARLSEGPDFAEEIADDAKRGTQHNMLGEALLDAQEFPMIVVRSISVEGSEPALTATVSISAAGHESTQVLPFTLVRTATQLTARADFGLAQSSLGLTPISVMMGALRVQDEIRVKIELVASSRSGGIESGGIGKRRDDDWGPLGSDE